MDFFSKIGRRKCLQQKRRGIIGTLKIENPQKISALMRNAYRLVISFCLLSSSTRSLIDSISDLFELCRIFSISATNCSFSARKSSASFDFRANKFFRICKNRAVFALIVRVVAEHGLDHRFWYSDVTS